jgi:RHS repeat-associated protein
MVIDVTGNLAGITRHDFLPFGEELSAGVGIRSAALGYGADSTRQKFTGKERDSETGLDYFHARYYSNIQGRFTSVDPENAGAIEDDPQSWNGYAYARNAPVVYSDPDGRRYRICSTDGECYEHSDDDFNAGRRAGTKDGFTFSGDGKYHETGDIRDKDGNLVATYEQISLDEPAHQLAFEMQRQFGSPDLYMRVARNLVGGAAMAAIAGRGGTIPAPRPFNPRVNTTSPTRGAALKEAKLANDIPLSRGPDRIIKPNTPGGAEVGLRSGDNVRLYEYTNSRGQKIWIREDKAASYGAPGGKGDQGPHFNSGPAGARQQDLKNHHYWSQ